MIARIFTLLAALAMAVSGVIQAVRPFDADPRVLGEEHLLLALFAAGLVLLIPGLLELRRFGSANLGVLAVSAGHVLLAFGATSSNVKGEDFSWFPYVALSANLAILAGSITMAVTLWRADRFPRPLAAALPLVWVCEVPLSQLGGGIVVGVFWLVVVHHLSKTPVYREAVTD
ncbi:hypothetical protein GT755_35040 [Herbidospora sp. NEAU-GS84]|uniref:Uncharacterized protein n=1 Tax=Herbidospora solisilvae TaxID=2696284 RepID=A0A7C9N1S8_9ACTN|nr:hypothetical protein [Herbidospora solisilvae]NAS26871.1 hypothetical protein [Herbidospora solisilvae]